MALFEKLLKLGIFLLTLTLATAEVNSKQRIGAELNTGLRKFYAEMLQSNLDHLTEYYDTLLRDMNPIPRDERGFKQRLQTIKDMKDRIGDTITVETVKISKQFIKIVFWELLLYQQTKEIKENPEKAKVMRVAYENLARKDNEDVLEFQRKLKEKWREIYKAIPAEELQQHENYNEINRLFDETENVEDTKIAAQKMLENFRKICEFFDYEEYKILFE